MEFILTKKKNDAQQLLISRFVVNSLTSYLKVECTVPIERQILTSFLKRKSPKRGRKKTGRGVGGFGYLKF